MPDTLIAFLDVETSGLSPVNDHIVQLGTVLYEPGSPAGAMTFNSLANPGKPIPEKASTIHGITDDKVRYAPPSQAVASDWWRSLREQAELRGKKLALAAHNAPFDLSMLAKYFPPEWPGVPVVCTLKLARRLDPSSPRHKLGYLVSERYGLDGEMAKDAHDALADCWMGVLLLEHYVKASGKGHAELAAWLAR